MTESEKAATRKPSLIRRIWNNYVPILVFLFFVQTFLNILFYYNDPEWDFSRYGPGVFLVTIFPLIWIGIYYWCKKIAKRKQKEKEGNA
jgi:hypothetical protein